MKKTYLSILSLATMALVFGSCQRDELESEVVGGEVEVSLSAGLPSGLTTYGSSHMGGATNVNADEFDLRYTLEVYDGEEVVYEATSIVPQNFDSENASFSARLLAKKYKFVLWADFVTNGTQDDLYYNTADLRNISYTGKVDAAKLSDDAVDAYYTWTSTSQPVENRSPESSSNDHSVRSGSSLRMLFPTGSTKQKLRPV